MNERNPLSQSLLLGISGGIADAENVREYRQLAQQRKRRKSAQDKAGDEEAEAESETEQWLHAIDSLVSSWEW